MTNISGKQQNRLEKPISGVSVQTELFLQELETAVAESTAKRLQKEEALKVQSKVIYKECKSIVAKYTKYLTSNVVKFKDDNIEKCSFVVGIFRKRKLYYRLIFCPTGFIVGGKGAHDFIPDLHKLGFPDMSGWNKDDFETILQDLIRVTLVYDEEEPYFLDPDQVERNF